MSIATKAQLRALLNRSMDIQGPHDFDERRQCILLTDFEAYNKDGEIHSRKLSWGDHVLLASVAQVEVRNRPLFVKPHQALYELGDVNGPLMITPIDGKIHMTVRFTAHTDVDLKDLSYLASIWVPD